MALVYGPYNACFLSVFRNEKSRYKHFLTVIISFKAKHTFSPRSSIRAKTVFYYNENFFISTENKLSRNYFLLITIQILRLRKKWG